MSWMNSGLVEAAAWAVGTRARLREGGAAQHGQARMRSCTTRKVQGVIHRCARSLRLRSAAVRPIAVRLWRAPPGAARAARGGGPGSRVRIYVDSAGAGAAGCVSLLGYEGNRQ